VSLILRVWNDPDDRSTKSAAMKVDAGGGGRRGGCFVGRRTDDRAPQKAVSGAPSTVGNGRDRRCWLAPAQPSRPPRPRHVLVTFNHGSSRHCAVMAKPTPGDPCSSALTFVAIQHGIATTCGWPAASPGRPGAAPRSSIHHRYGLGACRDRLNGQHRNGAAGIPARHLEIRQHRGPRAFPARRRSFRRLR